MKTQKMVLSALFLTLALVLPFLTGQIPQIGNMLCPMHFPILLCGFICGWPYGLVVGFISPLIRFILFGMPPVFPTGITMTFELATYGAVSGLIFSKAKHSLPMIFTSLIVAMVIGRLVWGTTRFLLALLTRVEFSPELFLSGALLAALPGILCQLILIPAIVTAFEHRRSVLLK